MLKEVKGYRVVRMKLPESNFYSYLYLREHVDREKNPSGKKQKQASSTLFVGNVDPAFGTDNQTIEENLKTIFEKYGTIQSISIPQESILINNFLNSRFAHITFASPSSLKNALKTEELTFSNENNQYLESDEENVASPTDYHKNKSILVKFYQPGPSIEDLNGEVEKFMRKYESKEKRELHELKHRSRKRDADGFTLVSYGKKGKNRAEKRQRELNLEAFGEKPSNDDEDDDDDDDAPKRKKRKTYELTNFYRFQMRESKREELARLREKFEEDKLKIMKLKESRKFKPF